MSLFTGLSVMPSKLRYKLLVAFCLMSLVPLLVGAYIASLFVHFPFTADTGTLLTLTLVMGFSLVLSVLGYHVTQKLVLPIIDVSRAAQQIAAGRLDEKPPDAKGSEELEELTRSLVTISRNAKELLDKVEKLSMKDKLTGLYNVTYLRERLEEEIQRAIHFQRPCSFALIAIDRYHEMLSRTSAAHCDEMLKMVAKILASNLSGFDRAAHIRNGEFAIIFSDKNKKRAIEIMDRIRRDVSASLLRSSEREEFKITISAGVSENPLDGVSTEELYKKAEWRVDSARKTGDAVEAFA